MGLISLLALALLFLLNVVFIFNWFYVVLCFNQLFLCFYDRKPPRAYLRSGV